MKHTFLIILVLAFLTTCSDEPYPVYDEGEVLWQANQELTSFTNVDMEPQITPDGNELVYIDAYAKDPYRFQLMKRNLITDEASFIYDYAYAIDLSPDGEWVAFNAAYGIIRKISVNGEGFAPFANINVGTANFSPTWHPDGKSIAYVRGGSSDATQPSGLCFLKNEEINEFIASVGGYPDIFPDGDRIIATRGYDQSIWKKFPILNIASKEEVARLDATVNANNQHPKVSPDGEKILYWNWEKGIYIMDVDGKNVQRIIPRLHFYEKKIGEYIGFISTSPSWHPDGKHIVYQHFAITEYIECPEGMSCTGNYPITLGYASVRKLKVRD